jgi:hypothetical protein
MWKGGLRRHPFRTAINSISTVDDIDGLTIWVVLSPNTRRDAVQRLTRMHTYAGSGVLVWSVPTHMMTAALMSRS